MAEMKDSAVAKFDKDALKRCLRLSDVADRWTEMTGQKFSEDDLLDFGESRDLEICVRLPRAKAKYVCGMPTPCKDDDILDVLAIAPMDIRLLRSESPKSAGITPKQLLVPKGFPDIAENPTLLFLRSLYQITSSIPPIATLRDCVITKIERDRFEQERFTNVQGDALDTADRNKEIFKRKQSGESFASISRDMCISPERVRQLFNKEKDRRALENTRQRFTGVIPQ